MKISSVTPDKATGHAVIVGITTVDDKRASPNLKLVGEDKNDAVGHYLNREGVSFGLGTTHDTIGSGKAVIMVGLGDPSKLTQQKIGTAISRGLAHAKSLAVEQVSTTLLLDTADADLDESLRAQALAEGAICGDLSFDQWKSKPKKGKKQPAIKTLQVLHPKPTSVRKALNAASILAEAVNDARLLANTPANVATPRWMASEARKRGKKHGFSVSVKGRTQLRKEGYNALTGVAQGSTNEEQLITMTYTPEKVTKNTKTLVLVGKGVTFDSGGISLKPGNGMWDMKYDKCGACNVIAAMPAIAQLKPKHKVIGITPCVENMPSGDAQRPGDIITAKDGTTIEILNTDAEGRLILADAVTYARTLKPDWILEQSTLTGACEYAVGKTYVAAMSKDDEFVDSIIDAANRAGDKAWKLPQGEEFDDGNKGTYADIQNISLKVKAGSSIGGAFVAHFAKDTKFCHLDIASKAWVDGQDFFGKGPTGAGLRIAVQRVLDES